MWKEWYNLKTSIFQPLMKYLIQATQLVEENTVKGWGERLKETFAVERPGGHHLTPLTLLSGMKDPLCVFWDDAGRGTQYVLRTLTQISEPISN